MRNNLHRATQIIAPAFFADNRIVNLAGGKIGLTRQGGGGITLIVTEIKISFGTVIGDKHLTVLKRAHGAGVNIDVRIHLLHRDFQTPRLHQGTNRSG